MYNNENIPNPFQLILDQLYSLERKIDEIILNKGVEKIGPAEDDLLTVQHATEYLRISPSALYQLTSRKEIPFMKRGKRLYFKKKELCQWVEEGSNKPSSLQEMQAQALHHLLPVKRKKLK